MALEREEQPPVIVCDSIKSLAIHNGLARLVLQRLTSEGGAVPSAEMIVPVAVIDQLIRTLQSVKR